jgi:hypothetical protein
MEALWFGVALIASPVYRSSTEYAMDQCILIPLKEEQPGPGAEGKPPKEKTIKKTRWPPARSRAKQGASKEVY